MSDAPLWRQAFDAVEKRVTPPAEQLVRTPGFSVGVAVVGRARALARGAARGVSARAWHLLNLPAGSDVSRLRSQLGALDREVRRLTVALETERRAGAGDGAPPATGGRSPASGGRARRATPPDPTVPPRRRTRPDPEDRHADGAQPADGDRPRPAGRRAQRPAGT